MMMNSIRNVTRKKIITIAIKVNIHSEKYVVDLSKNSRDTSEMKSI